MKPILSQHYHHDTRHYAFVRNSGLRRSDFVDNLTPRAWRNVIVGVVVALVFLLCISPVIVQVLGLT